MQIFIPTMGRTDPHRQITVRQIQTRAPEWINRTWLVCPPHEIDELRKIHPNVLPCFEKGISNVRQWICDVAVNQFICMIDDDMVFYKRLEMFLPDLFELENLGELFDLVQSTLHSGVKLVGLSARQGNHLVEDEYIDCTRQMNFHAMDRLFYNRQPVKWNDIHVMEDFHVTLSYLERGHPNRVFYRYCWNQSGSNKSGGCSEYRTLDTQRLGAEKLKELHPEFVQLVTKTSKWPGMPSRTDVRVSWKKAFRSKTNEADHNLDSD